MKRVLVKPLKRFMPEIRRVFAGHRCISSWNDPPHSDGIPPLGAHTHFCSEDRFYKTICIWNEGLIFNEDGTPSDIMWHEYAHILDADNFKGRFSCGGAADHIYETRVADSSYLQDFGHGPSWQKIMRDLGQTPRLVCEGPKGKDIWSMYFG